MDYELGADHVAAHAEELPLELLEADVAEYALHHRVALHAAGECDERQRVVVERVALHELLVAVHADLLGRAAERELGADPRAAAASRDAVDLHARVEQRAHHTDVGERAGAAAREHEPGGAPGEPARERLDAGCIPALLGHEPDRARLESLDPGVEAGARLVAVRGHDEVAALESPDLGDPLRRILAAAADADQPVGRAHAEGAPGVGHVGHGRHQHDLPVVALGAVEQPCVLVVRVAVRVARLCGLGGSAVVDAEDRPVLREEQSEVAADVAHGQVLAEADDRDGRRDGVGFEAGMLHVAELLAEHAREARGELGPLFEHAREVVARHVQQLAVAACADRRAPRRFGEQRELADGVAAAEHADHLRLRGASHPRSRSRAGP